MEGRGRVHSEIITGIVPVNIKKQPIFRRNERLLKNGANVRFGGGSGNTSSADFKAKRWVMERTHYWINRLRCI
jgi:hypothetical protein